MPAIRLISLDLKVGVLQHFFSKGIGWASLMIALMSGCMLTSPPEHLIQVVTSSTPLPAQTPVNPPVQMFVIAPGDNGQHGKAVGCGDSAIAVSNTYPASGDVATDLRIALQGLFKLGTDVLTGGYHNDWAGRDIAVNSVTVEGDRADVALSDVDPLTLAGVCSDAALRAQILLTVFQFPTLNSVYITYNNTNLKLIFDASGLTAPDDPFKRSDAG